MNKKLFYEQPQIRVLRVHTEGLMQAFSGDGYGDRTDSAWDEGDEVVEG